jgi:sulfite exporter TauE/SafE
VSQDAPFWLSLLAAGLAGSLHCVGMCGPILVGFAGAFRATAPADHAGRTGGRGLWVDFTAYHLGRIWTYALLGALAGLAGSGLRHGSELPGIQRLVSLILAALVVLAGLLMLGLGPILDRRLGGCAVERVRRLPLLGALVSGSGFTARLLLGSAMGLLPCGLVYAMLAVAAAQPTPLHGAAAMAVFGLGTLPALSGVLVAGRLLPRWMRAHGTRVAALLLLLAGGWMCVRALRTPHAHSQGRPAATLEHARHAPADGS